MMSKEQFWKIIEQSNQEKLSVDKNEQGESLQKIIQELTESEIIGFHARMIMLREQLDTSFMREIAFMMKYGDNDHAFEGFVNWVIVLGKAHYLKVQNSPPHLLTLEDTKLFVINRPYFPELSLVAPSAYFERTNLDIGHWVKALRSMLRRELYNVKKTNA